MIFSVIFKAFSFEFKFVLQSFPKNHPFCYKTSFVNDPLQLKYFKNTTYSEIPQNYVSSQMICPQIQFLQRWVAVVDSRSVFIDFHPVFRRIQLILHRIILNNSQNYQFSLQFSSLSTHHSIVKPHGDHEIGKFCNFVV